LSSVGGAEETEEHARGLQAKRVRREEEGAVLFLGTLVVLGVCESIARGTRRAWASR
jgi:hypothetical protein